MVLHTEIGKSPCPFHSSPRSWSGEEQDLVPPWHRTVIHTSPVSQDGAQVCRSAVSTDTPWTQLHGVPIASLVLVSFTEDWVRQKTPPGIPLSRQTCRPPQGEPQDDPVPAGHPVCNLHPNFLQQTAGFLAQCYFHILSAERGCPTALPSPPPWLLPRLGQSQ